MATALVHPRGCAADGVRAGCRGQAGRADGEEAAMAQTRPAGRRRGYAAGLDGIRAIAVIAVIAYHAGVPALRGGFIGVDLFFVVSGYLVTSLLREERERTGRIGFGRFLMRRGRRLLPALVLALTVVSAAAFALRRDLGVG